MTGQTKLALWRGRLGPLADDLVEIFRGCPSMTQGDHDRESRYVFSKICQRFEIPYLERQYIRKIWSDLIARRMDWVRGRLDDCAERKLQRELDALGQQRIPGA